MSDTLIVAIGSPLLSLSVFVPVVLVMRMRARARAATPPTPFALPAVELSLKVVWLPSPLSKPPQLTM